MIAKLSLTIIKRGTKTMIDYAEVIAAINKIEKLGMRLDRIGGEAGTDGDTCYFVAYVLMQLAEKVNEYGGFENAANGD